MGADQAPLGSSLHLLHFILMHPFGARQLVCVSSGTVRILSIHVCTQRSRCCCRERRCLQGSPRCFLPASSFLNDQLLLINRERTFCWNTGPSGRFLKHGSHSAICPFYWELPSICLDSVLFEIGGAHTSLSLPGNWA